MERRKKIAVELSDLVVYCRPVPFNEDSEHQTCLYFCFSKHVLCLISSLISCLFAEIGTERACYRDMSSFPETKAEKFATRSRGKRFLQYNRRQLSRVYPRGQRLDSSNYDPLPMWLCGSQLVALNFQTPGQCVGVTKGCFQRCKNGCLQMYFSSCETEIQNKCIILTRLAGGDINTL